jgi:hypothetical protein
MYICIHIDFQEAKEDETKTNISSDLWSVKKVADRHFWFLKDEQGAESVMMDSLSPDLRLDEEVERGELVRYNNRFDWCKIY